MCAQVHRLRENQTLHWSNFGTDTAGIDCTQKGGMPILILDRYLPLALSHLASITATGLIGRRHIRMPNAP